ncbi:MAG TPA: MaoC family dehydratase [Acidimicrobiales bacterium]|nr:MaoC family dehydratase [Acidimicrobiales bacterium]
MTDLSPEGAPQLAPALAALTGSGGYFEDFQVGQRMAHARAATVGEVENGWMSKLVMNTAQAHWNEHYLRGGPLGEGRVVFGLITASVVIGLSSQDTAENALAELSLDRLRFLAPVHHGDTLRAFTEVVGVEDDPGRPDGGRVRFHHWGLTQDDRVVFEGDRTVLIKRRSHWSR